jgi:hypothetical protein
MKEDPVVAPNIELSLKASLRFEYRDILKIPLAHPIDIGYGFPNGIY